MPSPNNPAASNRSLPISKRCIRNRCRRKRLFLQRFMSALQLGELLVALFRPQRPTARTAPRSPLTRQHHDQEPDRFMPLDADEHFHHAKHEHERERQERPPPRGSERIVRFDQARLHETVANFLRRRQARASSVSLIVAEPPLFTRSMIAISIGERPVGDCRRDNFQRCLASTTTDSSAAG